MVSLAEALACLSMVERFSDPHVDSRHSDRSLLNAIHLTSRQTLRSCRKRQERLEEWGETQ